MKKNHEIDPIIIPGSVDKYLIIAFQKGFIEIDSKNALLTPSGFIEMNVITEHCLSLMKDISADFEKMAESLTSMYGKKFSKVETFQVALLTLMGTEARLLAFLLNQKETDYKALLEAVKETMRINPSEPSPQPKVTSVTPFRKRGPKLDS